MNEKTPLEKASEKFASNYIAEFETPLKAGFLAGYEFAKLHQTGCQNCKCNKSDNQETPF